jgi:hypothetical protein
MSADQPTLARVRRAVSMRETAMPGDDAPMTPELRALYEQFERATTVQDRQEIWDAIVAHKRQRELRLGDDTVAARDSVVEQHKKRRLWPF